MEKNIGGDASNPEDVLGKILVVDDSKAQRRLVSAQLKKLGLPVIEASNGAEALELCHSYSPNFVISDWMMPGMSGLELCRAYRELRGNRYGYFILLTSKSEKGDIAEGLDVGADDFLTKPFHPAELRARIHAGQRILSMEHELTSKNNLVSATLDKMQALYDALDKDLIEARKLQQSLVRDRFVQLDGASISMLLQPAGRVGGDLVGAFPVSETEVGFYSLDVSGHGVASALLTARLAGHLSGNSPKQNIAIATGPKGPVMRSPAETVAALNTLILEEIETEHYFTILLARADLTSGLVTLCQAGHPHPVLNRADDVVELPCAGGLPVGLIDGAEFTEFSVQLEPGDRLFLGSDGITECENPSGQMLEDEGLAQTLRSVSKLRGPEALAQLYETLKAYNGSDDFADDVSGVLFDFSGASQIRAA